MENVDIWMKITSVAMTGIATLMLFMIKWIKDDIKELKNDIKDIKKDMTEIKKTLEEHGNRLVAIETGLKMFEWFEFKINKNRIGD